MSQGTKQFPTRIPVALHAALAAAATENNRSLNAEVIYRLDQTFQENPDCPPVAVDLLVTAAVEALGTVVTEVITTCFTRLEERMLEKLAPEVLITSVHIDTSHMSKEDIDKIGAGFIAEELKPFYSAASPTGRLSKSQPEISGLNTLPQAIRRGHTERLPLEGQTWVITGSLETMSRDKAREYLIQMGAEVAGVVVANQTSVLLWGPGAGSKLVKAKQHGVQLMEEAGFLDLLRAVDILPPKTEVQHLTVPGALDWDNPADGWTENTGSMPVQPNTMVKWRVRGGFGNTPEDVQGPEPASAIDWTLEDEPDAFDIMLWRLA